MLGPEFPAYNASYAILVVAIVSTVYVWVLLIYTSTRDPRIILRNLPPLEEELHYESSVSTENGGRMTPSLQLPCTKDVLINGVPTRVKYREICSNLIAKTASAISLARSFSSSDSLPLSDHGGLDHSRPWFIHQELFDATNGFSAKNP
ncbi:hypothetical protein Nepgr_027665 [Nepenthes gracilis]|uniref:Uncharacterized protein n=1 Tax=Nepenthes gracilis TaxID=150966 RepID=A0AAD3TAH5_NEPGR|nr:hypothetical protein Nepgr_027665 [Nepenthes gracilis]